MNRLRSHGVPLDRLYVVYLKGYTKFYTVLMMLLLNGSFVLWEGLRELCVPRLNNMVLNMKAQLSAIFLCTLVFNLGLFDRNYAVSVEQQLEPTRLCNASARKKEHRPLNNHQHLQPKHSVLLGNVLLLSEPIAHHLYSRQQQQQPYRSQKLTNTEQHILVMNLLTNPTHI